MKRCSRKPTGQNPASAGNLRLHRRRIRHHERASVGHRRIDLRGPQGAAKRQGTRRLRHADPADARTGENRPRRHSHRRRTDREVRLVRRGRGPDRGRHAGSVAAGDRRAGQRRRRRRLGRPARARRSRLDRRQRIADRPDRSVEARFLHGVEKRLRAPPRSWAIGIRRAASRFASTRRTVPRAAPSSP